MTVPAYDKIYVNDAQSCLDRMLDYEVNDLYYGIEEFFSLFINTGIADRFGTGDFSLIAGKSVIELALLVLEMAGLKTDIKETVFNPDRTPEYWTGWALAYYQWESNFPFREIVEKVPVKDIRNLYSPYLEMDIHQFCVKMNELIVHAADKQTNLQKFCKIPCLTQEELVQKICISVRTIQQYEQRSKNINSAQL